MPHRKKEELFRLAKPVRESANAKRARSSTTPSPYRKQNQSAELNRACALHRFDPRLNAALQRLKGLFCRSREDFAELGHFANIGVERRLREIRLKLERLMDRLGGEHGLRSRNRVFDGLFGVRIDLAVEALRALACRVGRLHIGLNRVLAVAEDLIVALHGLFEAVLQGF